MSIAKTYQPNQVENKWYDHWLKKEYFSSHPDEREAFTIVIPPPNVTGVLHMGHMLNNTLQDVLIRKARMQGFNACWVPGTDHASIATEAKVVQKLADEGIDKKDLSRNEFLNHAWLWKEKHGGIILEQLKKLGASCDWNRTKFTMDDDMNESVIDVFINLYNKGLIYRGVRMVNWDPSAQTALSDEEVIHKEVDSKLYHISYEIENSEEKIIIATTRPETILGDTAICVNPNDKRYQHLKNKRAIVPLVNRNIPIIFDEYVDMEFGTGCLKITPGHDFNDYEIGKKYSLYEEDNIVLTSKNIDDFKPINIFNDEAWTNENVPELFRNLDRFKVRKLVLSELAELELLVKEEEYDVSVPRGERSNIVIEPRLSNQWYVKTSDMAKKANKEVENGNIKFHPENWVKTYFNWMDNIEDWCISRQIWWGHRIPAWYDQEGNIYVGENEKDIREYYKLNDVKLHQDEDVLDTWFSSSLWPFGSLGWPENTEDFDSFFPTSLLVTGFDIIFFWVARMMMMSLEFTDQIPFKDVYVTGLIRDENGQKMSKSKGNVIDPLDLIYGITQDDLVKKRTDNLMQEGIAQKIERKTRNQFPKGIESYGTDALRMTFFSLATHTKDISFELGRLKGYRNFCTKIWNAARFINGYPDCNDLFEPKTDTDKWIKDEFDKIRAQIQKNIEDYRLDFAINEVYEFFWSKFCDVYIEECKKSGETANLRPMLKEILVMMHPFAPFITEEIHTLLFESQIID